MECQCAGCYPEREARRKHRETMDRIHEERERAKQCECGKRRLGQCGNGGKMCLKEVV